MWKSFHRSWWQRRSQFQELRDVLVAFNSCAAPLRSPIQSNAVRVTVFIPREAATCWSFLNLTSISQSHLRPLTVLHIRMTLTCRQSSWDQASPPVVTSKRRRLLTSRPRCLLCFASHRRAVRPGAYSWRRSKDDTRRLSQRYTLSDCHQTGRADRLCQTLLWSS